MALPKIKDMTDEEISREIASRQDAIRREANKRELKFLRQQAKEDSE